MENKTTGLDVIKESDDKARIKIQCDAVKCTYHNGIMTLNFGAVAKDKQMVDDLIQIAMSPKLVKEFVSSVIGTAYRHRHDHPEFEELFSSIDNKDSSNDSKE